MGEQSIASKLSEKRKNIFKYYSEEIPLACNQKHSKEFFDVYFDTFLAQKIGFAPAAFRQYVKDCMHCFEKSVRLQLKLDGREASIVYRGGKQVFVIGKDGLLAHVERVYSKRLQTKWYSIGSLVAAGAEPEWNATAKVYTGGGSEAIQFVVEDYTSPEINRLLKRQGYDTDRSLPAIVQVSFDESEWRNFKVKELHTKVSKCLTNHPWQNYTLEMLIKTAIKGFCKQLTVIGAGFKEAMYNEVEDNSL